MGIAKKIGIAVLVIVVIFLVGGYLAYQLDPCNDPIKRQSIACKEQVAREVSTSSSVLASGSGSLGKYDIKQVTFSLDRRSTIIIEVTSNNPIFWQLEIPAGADYEELIIPSKRTSGYHSERTILDPGLYRILVSNVGDYVAEVDVIVKIQ